MRLLRITLGGLLIVAAVLLLSPVYASATVHQKTIGDFFFAPLNTQILVGDTVRWTNTTAFNHTSTSDTRIWSSGIIPGGGTYSRQFLTPGVFPYQCSIHVAFGMRDTIRVGTTGVNDPQPAMPGNYELSQNYPNPFNAQTMIKFDLPVDAEVTLSVFDIVGRKVETLVAGAQTAGHHEIAWDASVFPSGIYFYQIQAGDFTQTKRATLLK
jgi:plastocyanin